MNYRAINNVVEAEYRRVQQEPRLRSVQSYTSCGGGLVKKTWRTAGFFLDDATENRLVFEILFVPANNVCVMRVYFEQPLTVLYARKFSACASVPLSALQEASQIFRDSADKICVLQDDSERVSEMVRKMPKGIQAMLSKVLVPIPPPLDLEEIQAAESLASLSPVPAKQIQDEARL